LEAALKDGDPIRAVIRGTATNSDGGTTGLTVPSQVAQEALSKLFSRPRSFCVWVSQVFLAVQITDFMTRVAQKAYEVAGLDPTHTIYVETHGTGTNVGDNNEIRAITSTFSSKRDSTKPVYISSVKTNVGHLECVSGLAGVIKTVLALERGLIAPHLNYEAPRPEFSLDEWSLKVRNYSATTFTPNLLMIDPVETPRMA
jgi:acyl transferase domain-containing protein